MSRYIDAERLEGDGWTMSRIRPASPTEMLYETKKPTDFPAADVVEVVRCKECKHADLFYPYCTIWEAAIDGDGYCYKGENE